LLTSVRAISVPTVLPRNWASSSLMRVGLTKPEGLRLTLLRRFLEEAFWAFFNSRATAFSRVLKSFLTVEKRPTSCWSLALNSVSLRETDEASGAAASATSCAAGASSLTGASSTLAFLARGLAAGLSEAASTTGAAATTGVVTGAETDLDVLTILAIIFYYHVSFLSYFFVNIYYLNMWLDIS